MIGTFLAALLPLVALASPAAPTPAIQPRVLVVTTFQYGDPAAPGAFGEAQRWIVRDRLTQRIPIAGLPQPLYCNERATECLIVTGVGKVNAASSILVAGLSPQLDLRASYILLAGIAGTTPDRASIGSVAWAGWVVDGGLAHEIDPREPLTSERFARRRLGCYGRPWCAHGQRNGTEVFALDASRRDWAYRASRTTALLDSPSVQRFRTHYRNTAFGDRPPRVLECDVLADDTYWQGAIMSAFASWWTKQWTGGRGTYCMTAMEDSGFLGGLHRLAQRNRVDLSHVMILRGASDYDRPYAGISPAESLRVGDTTGGFPLALENVYRAGEAVVRLLLAQ